MATTEKKAIRRSKPKTGEPVEMDLASAGAEEEREIRLRAAQLDPNDYATVINGFHGVLVYRSSRTGEVFEWSEYGDELEIQLVDLKSAKSVSKKFFEENWFLFDDPAVIEYLGVGRYYRHAFKPEQVEALFEGEESDLLEAAAEMSKSQKKTLAFLARKRIEEGNLDSMKLIRSLESAIGERLLDTEAGDVFERAL